MRIVFLGSDDFAAVCLKEILQSTHQIVGCVTGPDTRQGRGMKMTLSIIKEIALEHDVVCLQPDSLKEDSVVGKLKGFQADIFVVVAYGKILPQNVLNVPKTFCINVHGSLLPKYRGAAPVNWAILNGDKATGVTIQKMAPILDAGDIIAQEKIVIGPQETSAQLRVRMAEVGARLLARTLDDIKAGRYKLTPQDEAQATDAPKLTKEMGKIDWNRPAGQIYDQIRGLQPWPGAFTIYKGKMLKILEAALAEGQGSPGTVVNISKEGFAVTCGQDALLVKKVHLEASKAAPAYDFVQGHRLKAGETLV